LRLKIVHLRTTTAIISEPISEAKGLLVFLSVVRWE